MLVLNCSKEFHSNYKKFSLNRQTHREIMINTSPSKKTPIPLPKQDEQEIEVPNNLNNTIVDMVGDDVEKDNKMDQQIFRRNRICWKHQQGRETFRQRIQKGRGKSICKRRSCHHCVEAADRVRGS